MSWSELRDKILRPAETITPGGAVYTDLTDPAIIAARQRAAARMAEGIRSTYMTSSRGLEAPAGVGLKPQGDDWTAIIPTMTEAEYRAKRQAGFKAQGKSDEEARRLAWQSPYFAKPPTDNRVVSAEPVEPLIPRDTTRARTTTRRTNVL